MVGNGVFMSEFGLGEGRSDSARETAIVARQSKKERERAWQLFTYARFCGKGFHRSDTHHKGSHFLQFLMETIFGTIDDR